MTGVPMLDVEVKDDGSIVMLYPRSNRGEDWLEENLVDPLRFGRGFAVEWRFARDILAGMIESGLGIRAVV